MLPDLEGIAKEVHDETGIDAPVCAFELAEACGVVVKPSHRRVAGHIVESVISYPARARSVLQHLVIAHELGHWLLRRAGLDDGDEDAADYLALALLLPRLTFARDLARTDWDLFALMALHPHAPASALAQRMCHLSPSAATSVWDQGRLHRAFGTSDTEGLAEARTVVERVLELGEPVKKGLVSAWPIFDGTYRRVVALQRVA